MKHSFKIIFLVSALWTSAEFFHPATAAANHCSGAINNPTSGLICISVDFRFNRANPSDHGLSDRNAGFNPCMGEAPADFGNGICDASANGTGLLSPNNRQMFTELGPGTVTNNMFGRIVDFDGCIGVLSAGVCSPGANTVTPDLGNKLYNAVLQGIITPPMACFDTTTGKPTGLEPCASGSAPKTTTGQFYDAPRSDVGSLVLPSNPLTFGSTPGVNVGIATNAPGENLLEVYVWNPCNAVAAPGANFGCPTDPTKLNFVSPAHTAPLIVTCAAPAAGQTRACSQQAIQEENPGVGSAFVGDTGSELMLFTASWTTSNTGTDTSVIPSGSTVAVDWRVRAEQSTFRTDQTGSYTRCLGADALSTDPCYGFRMQNSDYVTGKLQTWGGDPASAVNNQSATQCAVFPTPNSGQSTSSSPSDGGYWIDSASVQHGC